MFEAAYLELERSGELAARVEAASARLASCDLCPRLCGVDRSADVTGACRTGRAVIVASAGAHYGEERCLVGRGGSGTIFVSWCNLNCRYCQNASISQRGEGRPLTAQQLAGLMLDLQRQGCHNINLVSPSHVVPQILAAVQIAARGGLRLPLVYNTGGYDRLETLALLDGVVDVYMPDMKYADPEVGARYSGVPDYPAANQAAVREMFRQVGDLVVEEAGLARRGLLVRHLVLPEGLAGTPETVRFLAALSPRTAVNVMGQYRPCYQAHTLPPLDRRVTRAEVDAARALAREAGLRLL
jgi:putative pyruvate formate lyase activating enzyme